MRLEGRSAMRTETVDYHPADRGGKRGTIGNSDAGDSLCRIEKVIRPELRVRVHWAEMRVLGIDCGTECTGYGVVELGSNDVLASIGYGGIRLSRQVPLPERLATIFDKLSTLIRQHRPDRVAIEDVFYAV